MSLKVTLSFVVIFYFLEIGECYNDKMRVCVVDGRGGFQKSSKHCPILDRPESKVECVVGIDRMDCLRRISKGKADFSVFTPEDLVTGMHSEVEVLLTNQMKFTKDLYEYEIVAIISDDSKIDSVHDLKDKKFCHPGYGYETDWTNILANFLESTIIPQSCQVNLTLTENRIKSSSGFFKSACKAGPWVNDPLLDAQLKSKYPNLCEICNNPSRCSINDKYWGRRGPLFCLTDGMGDISWARLDDVKIHFGLTPGSSSNPPEGYSYLCRDGTKIPLNSTTIKRNPCVWVAKPWPVIGAQREKAQEIQQFLNGLKHDTANEWEQALLTLIQNFKQDIVPLDPVQPIESYMMDAPGFLSANSFAGCHPSRTIRMCTTSTLQNAKCAWMQEAATVYGVEPNIDCIKANNITHCMEAIKNDVADIVLVEPDYVKIARNKFNLKTFLYETVNDEDKYITVALVKTTSDYKTLEDLKGAKACFPNSDGIAWNSVLQELQHQKLISSCPIESAFKDYFSKITAENLNKPVQKEKELSLHNDDKYSGDYGVIRCLNENLGDVGFLSKNSFDKFFNDPREYSYNINRKDFRFLCEENDDNNNKKVDKPCHLSWAPPGQLMTNVDNKTTVWMKDATDVFYQMDNLFGKYYKSVTIPFTMFDIFDGRRNVLFHDNTLRLKAEPRARNSDKMYKEYDQVLDSILNLQCSGVGKLRFNNLVIIFSIVFAMILTNFKGNLFILS